MQLLSGYPCCTLNSKWGNIQIFEVLFEVRGWVSNPVEPNLAIETVHHGCVWKPSHSWNSGWKVSSYSMIADVSAECAGWTYHMTTLVWNAAMHLCCDPQSMAHQLQCRARKKHVRSYWKLLKLYGGRPITQAVAVLSLTYDLPACSCLVLLWSSTPTVQCWPEVQTAFCPCHPQAPVKIAPAKHVFSLFFFFFRLCIYWMSHPSFHWL